MLVVATCRQLRKKKEDALRSKLEVRQLGVERLLGVELGYCAADS
jgi:hypothetical protein